MVKGAVAVTAAAATAVTMQPARCQLDQRRALWALLRRGLDLNV